MKKKKIPKILLLLTMIIGIVIFIITLTNKFFIKNINITPELRRLLSYEEVGSNDAEVLDDEGNALTAVSFDAFFLNDNDRRWSR